MDIENGSHMIARLTVARLALSRGERRVFDGLSFGLQSGEVVALTGANGAGKTSLLRAIAGFIRPDAGEIGFSEANGEPLDAEDVRARHIHLLGHHEGLKPARTARQELAFQAGWLGGAETGRDRARTDEAVTRLGLSPLLDLETRKLSAGQRRRLSLARLIAAPRALWLLDEPLAPLDAGWRDVAAGLMREHLKTGGLILAAVHDPLPVRARALDLGGGR